MLPNSPRAGRAPARSTLVAAMLAGIFVSEMAASADVTAGRAQQLQDMTEQLDRLDRAEFKERVEQAARCGAQRDFTCADEQIRRAGRVAHSDEEQRQLAQTVAELSAMRHQADVDDAAEAQRLAQERTRAEALVAQQALRATYAGLGPLRPYANITFLRESHYDEYGRAVRFSEGEDGSIVVSECKPDGTSCGRHVAVPSAANPGQYELRQTLYDESDEKSDVDRSITWKDGVLTFRYAESWSSGWFNLGKSTKVFTDSYWVQDGEVMYREGVWFSWNRDESFEVTRQLRAASESAMAAARAAQEENRRYRAEYAALTQPPAGGNYVAQGIAEGLAQFQRDSAGISNIHDQRMAIIEAQSEQRRRLERARAALPEPRDAPAPPPTASAPRASTSEGPAQTFIQKYRFGYTQTCESKSADCGAQDTGREAGRRRAALEASFQGNQEVSRRVAREEPMECISKPDAGRAGATRWTCTLRVDYLVSSRYPPDAIDPKRDEVHRDGFFDEP